LQPFSVALTDYRKAKSRNRRSSRNTCLLDLKSALKVILSDRPSLCMSVRLSVSVTLVIHAQMEQDSQIHFTLYDAE